ncbi:hypothetical protein RHSIM_Rhsim07G0176200 [Rhododendron simsii]|uniref:Cation/H+ exchanger transmembrane domain-containing protein n=1 Tax=Rhododendron simsii TaxID=118357 RepID=A0A834GQ47_RHOSS|nr:hypothetical protein RHSIM_Rhsim07G0176200 [Rhododendron simsii]
MASSLNSVLGKLEIVSTSDHASVVSMSLFVALLCACIVIGHLLEESRWMNESIVALLIGLCTGFVILLSSRWKSSRILVFSEDLFFIYLLPPIIFNAGQVPKQACGSKTSFLLQTGLLSAYIIKKLYIGRHSTDREVALMMLMAYLSYMIAELFYLSGILTVFFCGIVMSHYTWHNVTESSRITTKHAFATLSFVAEIFIFLYVGMDALDIEKWKLMSDRPGTSVAVSSILLGLILVGRAAFVFPLSFLSNLSKKTQNEKIGFKQQVTIWWAGLMRGAVSMALAYNKFTSSGHTHLQGHAVMITSTITVVLFSTVVFGLLTKPLVRLLLPKQSGSTVSSDPGTPKSPFTMPLLEGGDDRHTKEDVGSDKITRPSSLRLLLTTPTHTVHRLWRKFDDTFMRPVFGGRGFVPQAAFGNINLTISFNVLLSLAAGLVGILPEANQSRV